MRGCGWRARDDPDRARIAGFAALFAGHRSDEARSDRGGAMTPEDRIRRLPLWQGLPGIEPLGGGITNRNFLVRDATRRAVVRIGDDIPVHQILRFNELAASRAAHAAGISPAVLHHEPGILVIDFVEGRTLAAEDLRQRPMLEQALALVARAHREIPRHLRGPALMFWVFHVLRDYSATLREGSSPHLPRLPALMAQAARLEAAIGPIELVFGHNDLLPANFLHDGNRLWLIDWDYAGFNSPLFDLGGLAANNGLSPADEDWLLQAYYGQAADAALWRSYRAMKAAAALRETLWSMVSELHSDLDFDFAAYTAANLETFAAALAAFEEA
jgi:thiamine kinase-like enzyme